MKQKGRTVFQSILIVLVIFAVGILVGINTNIDGKIPTNINTAISFIVSIIALIFSMITYFSIDAVDKKNRMENNILQAEKYRPAYQAIMKNLNVVSEQEFTTAILNEIKKPQIYTCMQYADWIQNVIDHIIFLAYVKNNNDYKDELICSLEAQLNKYEGIGSEIDILLHENVLLIKNVLNYQNHRKNNEYNYSSLEDVRGEMLGNPISRIVYYDYLGLDYRGLAAQLMLAEFDGREFSEEYFSFWKDKYDLKEKEKCLFLVNLAKECFERALRETDNDILWEGYLKYNIARVRIMQFLLMDEESRKEIYSVIENILEESAAVRQNICYMFSKKGYLQERFEEEKRMAERLHGFFINVYGR